VTTSSPVEKEQIEKKCALFRHVWACAWLYIPSGTFRSMQEDAMPLYEYICDECEHQFEIIQRASDSEEITCPHCDAPARKLLSWFATGSSGPGGCGTGSSNGRFGGG
jgi:putative FmdB family regulatory protein